MAEEKLIAITSVLKEINSEYSLEGLMLTLKLQYFGHLMWRADSLEKTLMLGKIEGRRRRKWQRTRWLDGITDSMDMSLSMEGKPGVLQSTGSQRVGHDWATEQQRTNSTKKCWLIYEASVALITKSKDSTRRENHRPLFLMNIDRKAPNKILQIELNMYNNVETTSRPSVLYPSDAGLGQHLKVSQ